MNQSNLTSELQGYWIKAWFRSGDSYSGSFLQSLPHGQVMSINTYLIVCCPQQKEFSLYFHFPQGMFTYSNEDTEEVVMDEGNRNGGSVYVSKEDGTR